MTLAVSVARRGSLALALLLSSQGCGGDEMGPSDDDANPLGCAPGERRVDGKGCLPAGVQDNGCPAGTLGLEDGTCRPAGIPPEMCGEGFEPDGNGGCNAILPAERCPKGLMAVPGETICRDVAPCAPGIWGDIPVEPNTQHVDAAYAGASSDGSASHPWTTIQQGIDAAARGAIVAVAAGSYVEDVLVSLKPVRLWGRCPKLVEIVGTAPLEALLIQKGAHGTEVHDLALRGSEVGLALSRSENVVLDRLWIHDASSVGLNVGLTAAGAMSFALTRSLVEENGIIGASVNGADATVEATVVRDTNPQASNQQFGTGITIQRNPSTGQRSNATVRGSLVEGNREFGVGVIAADATIEATVVRDTQPQTSDQQFGGGIVVQVDTATGERASATVRACVVERNHEVGVAVLGSDATIEATVVRDTQPQASHQDYGDGIEIGYDPATGERASASVRFCLVERNHSFGVIAYVGGVTVDATVVRDTQPRASDGHFGEGIFIATDLGAGAHSATVRSCLVERSHEFGVAVSGAEATIEATVVRDTQARPLDGFFGDGLGAVSGAEAASPGTSATIASCLVANSARAGVSSFGAAVALSGTSFDCNSIQIDGENQPTVNFSFDDAGGNSCGCADERVTCRVLSAGLTGGLAVPEPLPPVN